MNTVDHLKLKGSLSAQAELIEQAKRRALEMREILPTTQPVDADHWVFKLSGRKGNPDGELQER